MWPLANQIHVTQAIVVRFKDANGDDQELRREGASVNVYENGRLVKTVDRCKVDQAFRLVRCHTWSQYTWGIRLGPREDLAVLWRVRMTS